MIVTKRVRAEAKVEAGEIVDVVMERDDEPRMVTPPPDLEQALKAHGSAHAAWEKAGYSRRKELVGAIEAAKRPETRARRIEKAIAELAGSQLISIKREEQ